MTTLEQLAELNSAATVKLRQRSTENGLVAEYLVRVIVDELDFLEVR